MYRIFLVFALLEAFATLIHVQALGRIVGGKYVDIMEHPYYASVRCLRRANCGGAIIKDNVVVTAAHCVLKPFFYYTIGYGSNDWNQSAICSVRKIVRHKFNKITYDNDIALVYLRGRITFGVNAQALPIDPVAFESGVVPGFGSASYKGAQSNRLRAVELTVVDWETCYRQQPRPLTDNMFCASGPGKDSCEGDSGGPFVADGTLVGIVSWGVGCALPRYPGVFVDVSKYVNWIKNRW